MAAETLPTGGAWIPDGLTSDVVQAVMKRSFVEGAGIRTETMTRRTRKIPRHGDTGIDVIDAGAAYTEDGGTSDEVELVARKFGRLFRFEEEDLVDAGPDVIASRRTAYARSYAKAIDNACLGVTDITVNVAGGVPFSSLFAVLNLSTDNGYTAGANVVTAPTATAVTYDDLSNTMAKVEDGDYFDEERLEWAAHPHFRQALRDIKDSQNNPIFVKGLAGTPDTIFGVPVFWTYGAKQHATFTPNPTGSPLALLVNKDYVALGRRSGPESQASAQGGDGFTTDEPAVKMRVRRGFVVTVPQAHAVLVDVP